MGVAPLQGRTVWNSRISGHWPGYHPPDNYLPWWTTLRIDLLVPQSAQSQSPPRSPRFPGELVRSLRLRRKLTLEKLALEVGLSKGHLSRFERGEKSLSVSSLVRLSKSLNTSITALLGEVPHEDLLHVVRAAGRTARQVGESAGYEFFALARAGDHGSGAFIMSFSENAVVGQATDHAGEEILYIISGSIELELETKSILLRTGDYAQYPGSMSHKLRGLEAGTQVLIVVTNSEGRH